MAAARDRTGAGRGVGFNMTPMIDIVFLLIIFFMLVSNFASAERASMELPKPYKSQAKKVKLTDRVIVNCQLAGVDLSGSPVVRYRVGPNPPESLDRISSRLAAAKGAADADGRDLIVVIRADRRLPYADVRAAIRVVADNRIEQMRLVAHVGEDH